MAENETDAKPSSHEIQPLVEEENEKPTQSLVHEEEPKHQGFGGWDFSPLSYLSDLQKAATSAAEEISRNAVEVAKTAAKSLSEMQNEDEGSDTSKERDREESGAEESEDEEDKRRKAALEKLENASEDNFLGQGLKALDNTVENLASGAWEAFGNALKGGSDLVHKLEDSAVNMAGSLQQGGQPVATGSVAPSLIETGKAFTTKGMEVLEIVGKETMDLLSIESEKDVKGSGGKTDEDQVEEVNFDRCFYIYGGPEQLEELEALSNHHALLLNRRKAKLSPEQKDFYDGKLKDVQQIFDLSSAVDGSGVESDKGKKEETASESRIDELQSLYDSSAKKAAELASGPRGSAPTPPEKTVDHPIDSQGVRRFNTEDSAATGSTSPAKKRLKPTTALGFTDSAPCSISVTAHRSVSATLPSYPIRHSSSNFFIPCFGMMYHILAAMNDKVCSIQLFADDGYVNDWIPQCSVIVFSILAIIQTLRAQRLLRCLDCERSIFLDTFLKQYPLDHLPTFRILPDFIPFCFSTLMDQCPSF